MGKLDKEVDFLVKTVIKQKDPLGGNYKVVTSGGGHKKILDSKGKSVTDENGPLIISSSPGDARWRDLAVTRLKRAGVLKNDPWGGDGSNDEHRDRQEPDFEAKAARRAAQLADQRSREQRNQDLRQLVEPMMVKLGGWGRGTTTELSATAQYWLKNNLPELAWPSDGAAKQAAHQLKSGNMQSERAVDAWTTFFKMLESNETPRQLYFDLVREARGIPAIASRTGNVSLAQRITVVDPDESTEVRAAPGTEGLPTPPPDPFPRVQPLREAHKKSGLVWNVEFSLDEYADAQRAMGFVEGLAVAVAHGNGEAKAAVERLERLLIKIGEFRFYEMVGREE